MSANTFLVLIALAGALGIVALWKSHSVVEQGNRRDPWEQAFQEVEDARKEGRRPDQQVFVGLTKAPGERR